MLPLSGETIPRATDLENSQVSNSRRRCPVCHTTFRRREHLIRHAHRHSGDKPFKCNWCTKSFSRRDALQRHIGIHKSSSALTKDPLITPNTLRFRACHRCAASKQKCGGTDPCTRCQQKGLSCVYPNNAAALREDVQSIAVLGFSNPLPQLDGLPQTEAQDPKECDDQSRLTIKGHLALTGCETTEPQSCVVEPLPNLENPNLEFPGVLASPGLFTDSRGLDDLPWTIDDFSSFNSPLWLTDINADPYQADLTFLHEFSLSNNFTIQSSNMLQGPANDTFHHGSLDGAQDSMEGRAAESSKGVTKPLLSGLQPQHKLLPEDHLILMAEVFGHVNSLPSTALVRLSVYCVQHDNLRWIVTEPVIHSFVELYFEHFDRYMPFIHPTLLQENDVHWILLLAVAAVGAQFSSLKHASQYSITLQEILYRVVAAEHPRTPPRDDLTWIRIVLLHDLCLCFGGSRQLQLQQQYEKTRLVTLCRAIKAVLYDVEAHTRPNNSMDITSQSWQAWLESESRNRLVHSVYNFEHLQFLFFDIRPAIDMTDVTVRLPRDDAAWRCQTEMQWRSWLARADIESAGNNFREADSEEERHLAEYSSRLQFTYICVEERLGIERLQNSPFHLVLHSLSGVDRAKRLSGFKPDQGIFRNLCLSIRQSVRTELDLFRPQLGRDLSQAEICTDQEVLYPMLRLVRQVPLRTLYVFSGYEASAAQVKEVQEQLISWTSSHPGQARGCLIYAATIFTTLRAKKHFAPYDPFCLLVASLYILVYELLVVAPDITSDERRGRETLRLDRQEDLQATQAWIVDGGPQHLYIAGIGTLDGKDSQRRVLEAMRRVLLTRSGWPILRHNLAQLVAQVIRGKQPILEDLDKPALNADGFPLEGGHQNDD